MSNTLHAINTMIFKKPSKFKIIAITIFEFLFQGLLISCNQMSAEYLFMTDKLYDISYDTGDKVIQCGRHNDIFKLWLQWRGKGTEGFEKTVDTLMDLALYQVERIKAQPDKFHLILEPECVNVSFWYIPKRLRGVPHTPEKEKELGKVIFYFYFFNYYIQFGFEPVVFFFILHLDLPNNQGKNDGGWNIDGRLSTR